MAVTQGGLITPASSRPTESRRTTRGGGYPWRLIALAGLAFALLGWTDVLLLWYPLRVGTPEWEFATVSGSFDALPLATIGILLISVRLYVDGGAVARRVMGAFCGLVALALVGAFVLFALSFATGIGQVQNETQWILVRAGTKTSVAALLYVVLYSYMALSLFRAARKDRLA